MLNSVKYGILLDGELLRCSAHRNRQPHSVEFTVQLTPYGDEPWLVDDITTAQAVLSPDYQSPGWYNADHEHPLIEVDLSTAKLAQVSTQVIPL